MSTIKSFTDLSQSKTLSKFLPLESADGGWYGTNNPFAANDTFWLHTKYSNKAAFPAWSLSALLGVLPNNEHITTTLSRGCWKIEPVEYIDKWFCEYEDEVDEDSPCKNFSVSADNPVDACVNMIIKLNELNLL